VNRAAIGVALVATFLIGASLGLMGGILFSGRWHGDRAPRWAEGRLRGGEPGPQGREGPRSDVMVIRLRQALDLSDAQVERIRPLLEQAHTTMLGARESLRVRIEVVLTPEQRARWRQLEARRAYPGRPRGPFGHANRAQPGEEGEPR
jgi:hypothetical protein